MTAVLGRRRAGVLLHPTSLPGPGPQGTLGTAAYRFIDLLSASGFSVWQTLPLGPADAHGSPYCLQSAHAGDPRLIDTDALARSGLLPPDLPLDRLVDAPEVTYRAFARAATSAATADLARFARRERAWLFHYALFGMCSRRFDGTPWWEWPAAYRDPAAGAPEAWAEDREAFRGAVFQQYLFFRQWSEVKHYANARGVHLFGDMPFYLDRNSVEVWRHRELFQLDAGGRPTCVAGVPPDYFSADGQLWGNPLYDWEMHARRDFDWWIGRIAGQLSRFDLLRIDHFRALESYWVVPAGAQTARAGHWQPCPGAALLARLRERLGELPLVAEDLGIITDEVRALRDKFGLPGMLVLQFAFDGRQDNPYRPANHRENAVVYTGTHDNDTTAGWFAGLDEGEQRFVYECLGKPLRDMPDALIEAACASPAQLAVIPMQDLLGLGSEARMNTPGTTQGNWRWRFDWDDIPAGLAGKCRERVRRHDRLRTGTQT